MKRMKPHQCSGCGRLLMAEVSPTHDHPGGESFECREVVELHFAPVPFEELEARVDRLEPRLRERFWYPMSFMMIPSVLASADLLLLELSVYQGPEQERAAALYGRLEALRQDFRRDPCPRAGKAPEDD